MTTPSTTPDEDNHLQSRWIHLPTDILTTIATLLGPSISHVRLRSICHSWRTTLSPSPPPPLLHFPLSLPSPTTTSTISLHHRPFYLLISPLDPTSPFLLHLNHHNTATTSTAFSLLNPLTSNTQSHHPTTINLLNHGIIPLPSPSTFITTTTIFTKIAVSTTFTPTSPLTILALTSNSTTLLIWNHGDPTWTELTGTHVRSYNDIVSHNGKFYAIADHRGRLVVIDQRLQVIDVVPKLVFGGGRKASLVARRDEDENEGGLYLVDRGNDHVLGVYKLDEKGRFWDYEYDLGGCVFFLGEGQRGSFSLSPTVYGGRVRNVVYFVGPEGDECVWDVKTRELRNVVDDDDCRKLFWPPFDWLRGLPHD